MALDLEYHNQPRRFLQTTATSDSSFLDHYPKNGPVVATLLASREKDVQDLCVALTSLAFLGGDSKDFPAPILVFNEGDLSEEQVKFVVSCTERPVAFPQVDFKTFPDGFDEKVISKMFRVEGRKEWGYYQMIRFWITGIWKHPALEPFGTVMRIDSDSCFKATNEYLPNFKHDNLLYYSQFVGFEDGKNYTTGLLDFAEDFMKSIGRHPGDPLMWAFIKTTWEEHQSLPLFMTNFEVSRKSFMQRPDVAKWHEALTEKEPFGIFRYRWGDAVTRFLTAAMFAQNHQVMTSYPEGYGHKENCPVNEVHQALANAFKD